MSESYSTTKKFTDDIDVRTKITNVRMPYEKSHRKVQKWQKFWAKRNPWGAVMVAAGAGLLVDGAIDKAF